MTGIGSYGAKSFRKQQWVKEMLEKRGEEPGLVCILSAMEPCGRYKPGHDQKTHKTYLRPDDGKCRHDYVYLIDNHLGLCYVRAPTWCPFRLQVYCNGHGYLARQLSQSKIEYRILDNGFGGIADFDQAPKLADEFPAEMRHRHLDDFAAGSCPVLKPLALRYKREPGPSGIGHRLGVCQASRLASYLSPADGNRHSHS